MPVGKHQDVSLRCQSALSYQVYRRTVQNLPTVVMSDDASDGVRINTDTGSDNSAADTHTTSMSSSPQSTIGSSHLPIWVLKMRLKIANSRI